MKAMFVSIWLVGAALGCGAETAQQQVIGSDATLEVAYSGADARHVALFADAQALTAARTELDHFFASRSPAAGQVALMVTLREGPAVHRWQLSGTPQEVGARHNELNQMFGTWFGAEASQNGAQESVLPAEDPTGEGCWRCSVSYLCRCLKCVPIKCPLQS